MATDPDKAQAAKVQAMASRGLSTTAALWATAGEDGLTPEDVLHAARTTRYLVMHERDVMLHATGHKPSALLAELPDDVLVFPYGHAPAVESLRIQMCRDMGVQISALPSIIAWQDATEIEDEDGNPVTIPAGYRCVALRDAADHRWTDDAPPVDRKPHPSTWCRCRTKPPPPVRV